MWEEFLGKLFVSGIFGFAGVPDDVIDFLFDVLELDSEAFVELVVPFVCVVGSDDFNELF